MWERVTMVPLDRATTHALFSVLTLEHATTVQLRPATTHVYAVMRQHVTTAETTMVATTYVITAASQHARTPTLAITVQWDHVITAVAKTPTPATTAT